MKDSELQQRLKQTCEMLWWATKACGGTFTIPADVKSGNVPKGAQIRTEFDAAGNFVIIADGTYIPRVN